LRATRWSGRSLNLLMDHHEMDPRPHDTVIRTATQTTVVHHFSSFLRFTGCRNPTGGRGRGRRGTVQTSRMTAMGRPVGPYSTTTSSGTSPTHRPRTDSTATATTLHGTLHRHGLRTRSDATTRLGRERNDWLIPNSTTAARARRRTTRLASRCHRLRRDIAGVPQQRLQNGTGRTRPPLRATLTGWHPPTCSTCHD
jgi:hypothetical protein